MNPVNVPRWNMVFLLLCVFAGGCSKVQVQRHEETGQPVRGGMLEILSISDFDHLFSASGYTDISQNLLRAFTRTLVTYPASNDFKIATRLMPDLALETPSLENGGISADGLTYTFHLRRGVYWDTAPPREVSAYDFIRAFKLFCNPVSSVAVPAYYTNAIKGFSNYCSRFAGVPNDVTAIRDFVNNNEIEGVRAAGDFTLIFRLLSPASDFLNLVATSFAAPMPVEYLNYLPDSPAFRQHTISIGPYRITHYIQDHEMLLERNPAWVPATDPIRPAYVDRIHYRFGIDTALQQLQVEAGTADLNNGLTHIELASLMAHRDSIVTRWPPGESSFGYWYIYFNHVSPNNHGALKQLQVRRAIALAVDKSAIMQLFGGAREVHVLRQAIPSCVSGYRIGADQYITPGDRGNPAEARRLLSEAGYPKGITLRLAYFEVSTQAQALQASLGRAGISLKLLPETFADFTGRLLANRENARRGEWDLVLSNWYPDWYGENNGRSLIVPLFDSRHSGNNMSNPGLYANPDVDALIDRALAAKNTKIAGQAWNEAAQRLMDDVALVPLIEYKVAFTTSRRVRNCAYSVIAPRCDITSVWLADAASKKGKLK